MRILITGGSGLIGQALCAKLLEAGHDLVVLGRSSDESFRKKFTLPVDYHQWKNPLETAPPFEALEGVDAVVHLAGESIAQGRWSEGQKNRIRSSRVEVTRNLKDAINKLSHPPSVIVGASAIGFYGDTGDELADESHPRGQDFLSQVCHDWEQAWEGLEESIRLVNLRIGVVLSEHGGFLKAMEPIFSNGVGGKIASGQQWISWIDQVDLLRMIAFALDNDQVRGPVNAVAPHPVRNVELTQALAEVHHTWSFLPVPSFAMKIVAGEMSTLALSSQRIDSSKATGLGFEFKFAELSSSLQNCYGWKKKSGDQLFWRQTFINEPVEKVFDFFSQAKNLEKITPDSLQFKIEAMSTDSIEEGTLIDYKLKVHGVPMKWKTIIEDWRPKERFRDVQLKGPYSVWQHDHIFQPLGQGTLMTDRVVYRVPMGVLGRGPISSFVKSDINKIFDYRQTQIGELLD